MENKNTENSTDSEFVELNYWKSSYDEVGKKITIAYMYCGESGGAYKIKNFQDIASEGAVAMDNTVPFYLHIHTIYLPKSYCKIVKDVPDMPHFKFIEIPYWIYMKNKTKLMMRRNQESDRRGIFSMPHVYRSKEFYDNLRDPETQRGLKSMGISEAKYEQYLKDENYDK